MSHGTPDWGLTAGQETVYQMTDLGELAARLGSPITHDRRGDVIWWDDFEWSLNKWTSVVSGAGGSVAVSPTWARNGRMSVHIVAGSTVNQQAYMDHLEPLAALGRLGAEWSVMLASAFTYLQGGLTVLTGSRQLTFSWRWVWATGQFQVQDDTGTYVAVSPVAQLEPADGLFHTFKVVVDTAGETYVRAIINNLTYDLSGIGCQAAASAAAPYMDLQLLLKDSSGTNGDVYVDDVILTQNEPA